ncbi:MAG TPA: BTAD domain-containing putative transcriptional regulator, partial [Mycobacteriales bacterium]|nr:BTAD domain-containing putative transcriptional regulator [Mycobacteriales bacterium]
MRIALLGPLEVMDGDRVVTIRGARLRALLARLALQPGRVVATATLVDDLWGEALPADAANALQSLVSRLRRSLGPSAVALQSTATGYVLQIDPDAVDAQQFTALARRGRQLLEDDQAAAAVSTLRQALALWRGPALSDSTDAPYATAVAERLAGERLSTHIDRIEADLRLGHYSEVVPELERLIETHPLRERLSSQLMTALYHTGRQADALTHYERTRTALSAELGVDPSPELQRIHLELLRGELPERRPPPTNLRAQLTSFVGRDAEVQRLAEALSRSRLVSIVGPGGAGKTRLASEAAATMLTTAPDGVWFVGLAPIADAAEVAPAVLSTLGGREHSLLDRRPIAPADVEDRLIAHIGQRRMLLVLDNCEHLVAAAAALADTLLAA